MVNIECRDISVDTFLSRINHERKADQNKEKQVGDLFSLRFNQLCEVKALLEMKENGVFSSLGVDNVDFFRGKGTDIRLNEKNGEHIHIEIKGSGKKRDYFNQGFYRNKKVYFYGNSLKLKDFNLLTGNTKADYVILVTCNCSKENVCPGSTFNYYVISRKVISNLSPKSTVFMPSFLLNIMVRDGISLITDEFCDLKKGIMQLICDFSIEEEGLDEKKLLDDFRKVWCNDYECPLLANEFTRIENHLLGKNRNDWTIISQGKIDRKENGPVREDIFRSNPCGFYELDKQPACTKCKNHFTRIWENGNAL